MSYLTLASVLIAILGLAFAVTGIRRLFQRRFLKSLALEFSAGFILLLAFSAFLLASNLYTYQRLIYEQPVAEVTFHQLAEQNFSAEIKSLDSNFQQTFDLHGDEWQLDAQVLTWQGIASLFGLDANYRLHRISGRYLSIEQEQQRPRSVFSLVKESPYAKSIPIDTGKFDLWQFAHDQRKWLRWVDAAYGSAVFLPMTDGAKYNVAISRTGLIARPGNKAARQAVSNWIGL